MILILTITALVMAMAVACWYYDVSQTVKGIKNNIAVEDFSWLVGTKPSALALYLRGLIFFLPFAAAPAAFVIFSQSAAMLPVLLGPVAFGIRHYQGGKLWATLKPMTYDERVAYLNRSRTAWQKFWGA